MKPQPTPYQLIVRAGRDRRGLRLTAEEARVLSMDEAIMARAVMDDEAEARGCADEWHETTNTRIRSMQPERCPSCGSN